MRTTAENRFLSVRVPAALRRPLKELAARQQTSVQQLVRQALEELLREADKSSPGLTETLGTLRAHADDFRRQGVRHLYLFGSVARGDARPTSDIDIAVDIDPVVVERPPRHHPDDARDLLVPLRLLAFPREKLLEGLASTVQRGRHVTLLRVAICAGSKDPGYPG